MGPRPPSSRGQDLDARTTGGGRAVREQPLPDVVRRVGGMGPRPPSSRGQDLDARTTGGEGERTVREQPLRVVCQPGGRDGSPPPVFTGAGSRREDNGGGGRFANKAPTRWMSDGWEGWVPAPRLHGGRISTRGQRGRGGLGLEVGDDGFEGLDGLVYVSVGVGEGGVELLGALEDSLLLDEVAESGLNCVVGG